MKQRLLFMSLVMSLLVLMNACKKDSSPNNFDKLTNNGGSRSWKLTSITGPDGQDHAPPCPTDNIITFNRSGTVSIQVTDTKCNIRAGIGKWTLVDDEKTLVLADEISGSEARLTIAELTDSKLVFIENGALMTYTAQ